MSESDTPRTDESISWHTEYEGYGHDRVEVKCEHVEVTDCRNIERDMQAAIDARDIELARAQARIAELEVERDALRKDAERYRWLRENMTYRDLGTTSRDGKLEYPLTRRWYHDTANQRDATIDAAIDAAMSAKEPKP